MMPFTSPDLAIDLGCSTTRIHLRGHGLLVSEPSVVAVKKNGGAAGQFLAAGNAAKEMIGRVPDEIAVVSPVLGGVITDFDTMHTMLELASEKKRIFSRVRKPRIIVPVPSDLTPIERAAFKKSAMQAGGREVQLVPKAIAAAVGLDLALYESTGRCIVDLGQGTTEISVISSSRIVTSYTERLGSASLDTALKSFVRRKFNLLIGDDAAERLKCELGSAHYSDDGTSTEVRGRSLISGNPSAVEIHTDDVREALEDSITTLVDKITDTLERTPPELAGDLYEGGISLVGGGALLSGLDLRLREATGLSVRVAKDARNAVIHGAGTIVDQRRQFRGLFV